MTDTLPRRRLLQAGLASGVMLLAPRARACEFFSSNLRIYHPWTRATAPGAEFATVCMKFDEVREDDRLIGIETPVAQGAELLGPAAPGPVDFAIPAGVETALAETGTQLRLVGLTQPIEVGRAYPLTLRFKRGGQVNALLNVDYTAFRFR